ncbi:MsnO8 family LLM class oxidoreductase [Sphaerisporangium aureirubrum]|uniref:MsnO8 family LLM class oxidoreductase n=1 Tax=Sphaerisporangium aureirubrum TaxID=1544736 RepID=A0ABW1NUV7_9ACTN
MTVRLSVLDQSPVTEGSTPSAALAATVRLARDLDGLGVTRYWLAEHHNSPGFAGTAPEILAATLLAVTRHLRVGSGGVLLPRYDPVKVAETFRVLSGLYPHRVDLGVGRAGGPAQRFPEQVVRLLHALGVPPALEGLPGAASPPVMPSGTVAPQVWLLGAGTTSATLAAQLGTAFGFAHFLNPEPGREALGRYLRGFTAPSGAPSPRGALAVRVLTADTMAKVQALVSAVLLWRSRKDLGQDAPLPSPETVRRHRWTGDELRQAAVAKRTLVFGTPEQVGEQLTKLAAAHGVEELIVNTPTHDPADRLRSYRLLAETLAIRPPAEAAQVTSLPSVPRPPKPRPESLLP